ncbi:MAG: DUF998 domain-containing protein [Bacteroidales bacterium]|jgi:hypothetical protein|nr:DUF998 domain-containing protein [Bacteroidales bacterium]
MNCFFNNLENIALFSMCASIAIMAFYFWIDRKLFHNGDDPTSLSATYYDWRWVFRALFALLGILAIPAALYFSPWIWISVAGIWGVGIYADFKKNGVYPKHLACAGLAAGGTVIASFAQSDSIWIPIVCYGVVLIWFAGKCLRKNSAWALQIEKAAFYGFFASVIGTILKRKIDRAKDGNAKKQPPAKKQTPERIDVEDETPEEQLDETSGETPKEPSKKRRTRHRYENQ